MRHRVPDSAADAVGERSTRRRRQLHYRPHAVRGFRAFYRPLEATKDTNCQGEASPKSGDSEAGRRGGHS